jgi:rhamnose utilization protein RhaD (predicted bifunctional aldolase and dehydrogenase)
MREIYPRLGKDPVLPVTAVVYREINDLAEEFAGGPTGVLTPDDVIEIARRVLVADRTEQRRRAARHARGDYEPEIQEAYDAAETVYTRTDAEPYEAAQSIKDLLIHAKHKGFTSDTVTELLKYQDDLENELARTTKAAGELRRLILVLKGDEFDG